MGMDTLRASNGLHIVEHVQISSKRDFDSLQTIMSKPRTDFYYEEPNIET